VSELDAAVLHPALQDSGDDRLYRFAVAAELRRTANPVVLVVQSHEQGVDEVGASDQLAT
jgi:hypothetical protein